MIASYDHDVAAMAELLYLVEGGNKLAYRYTALIAQILEVAGEIELTVNEMKLIGMPVPNEESTRELLEWARQRRGINTAALGCYLWKCPTYSLSEQTPFEENQF